MMCDQSVIDPWAALVMLFIRPLLFLAADWGPLSPMSPLPSSLPRYSIPHPHTSAHYSLEHYSSSCAAAALCLTSSLLTESLLTGTVVGVLPARVVGVTKHTGLPLSSPSHEVCCYVVRHALADFYYRCKYIASNVLIYLFIFSC